MNTSFLWFPFPRDDILCVFKFVMFIDRDSSWRNTTVLLHVIRSLNCVVRPYQYAICLNMVHIIYLCYPLGRSILGVHVSAPERKWAGYVRAWGNRPVTRSKTWPSASPVFKHLGCQAWPVTPLARLMVSIPHCSIFFVSNLLSSFLQCLRVIGAVRNERNLEALDIGLS